MKPAKRWVGGQYRYWAPAFAVLAIAWLASAAFANVATFAPAGEHLSVQMPPNPAQKDTEVAGTKIREWTATDSGFFYLVQHGVHAGTVFQPAQLDADLKDFVSGTKCTVTAQQRTTAPGPNGPLPALRFSFKMPNGAPGEGLWTITGDKAFGAIVLAQTKAGRRQPMASFINSLRIVN